MLHTDLARDSTEPAAHDRRREERISIEFPNEVSGFNCAGRFESENTSTQNVSDASCNFHLTMEVEAGMVLAIRVMTMTNGMKADPAPVLFCVARVERIPGGYSVGAVKLAPRAPWSTQVLKSNPSQKFLF